MIKEQPSLLVHGTIKSRDILLRLWKGGDSKICFYADLLEVNDSP